METLTFEEQQIVQSALRGQIQFAESFYPENVENTKAKINAIAEKLGIDVNMPLYIEVNKLLTYKTKERHQYNQDYPTFKISVGEKDESSKRYVMEEALIPESVVSR